MTLTYFRTKKEHLDYLLLDGMPLDLARKAVKEAYEQKDSR